MLDMQKIGRKICACRAACGFNQDKVSELLYVSRQAVSRWETGQSLPTIDNIVELAKLFSVSVEELLCLNEAEPIGEENLFVGHDRAYVVKRICEGTVDIDLAKNFYRFSDGERMLILRSLKKRNVEPDKALLVKLTDEERRFCQTEWKNGIKGWSVWN